MEKNDVAFGVLAYMAMDAFAHLQAGCRNLDFMERVHGAGYLADVQEEEAEFRRIEAALGALLERMNERAPEKMASMKQRRADEHA